VLIVLKSGSLNLLELSGPVKACNGTALPLLLLHLTILSVTQTTQHHTTEQQGTVESAEVNSGTIQAFALRTEENHTIT
jgi:hypothetical protein